MNLTRVYLAFSCRISYSAVTTILSRDICLLVASLITSKRHPGRDANAILAANTKHYPLLFDCTLYMYSRRASHFGRQKNSTSKRSQPDFKSFACNKLKHQTTVAHTRLPSVRFRSWSWFLAVSLQVTWVINQAVGCKRLYFDLKLLTFRGFLYIFPFYGPCCLN